MVDLARAYHHGIRVPNLDRAMTELEEGLGVAWCSVQESAQTVWLPGAGMTTIPLRFTYSTDGPLHLELLEGARGSIWDGHEFPGLHHVGVWTDDVAADTRSLVEAGWTLLMAQNAPEKNYGVFTYLQPPSGLIVELVWSAIRPMFEKWFAGGELG